MRRIKSGAKNLLQCPGNSEWVDSGEGEGELTGGVHQGQQLFIGWSGWCGVLGGVGCGK